MALRMSVVIRIVAPLFLVYLLIYYRIFVRMVMRYGNTKDDFDLHLNRTHLDLSAPKSSPEKTEYKTPLRKSNFWVPKSSLEKLRKSNFWVPARSPSVSVTLSPYRQANGPTFVPGRKLNLKVKKGRTDMPDL